MLNEPWLGERLNANIWVCVMMEGTLTWRGAEEADELAEKSILKRFIQSV